MVRTRVQGRAHLAIGSPRVCTYVRRDFSRATLQMKRSCVIAGWCVLRDDANLMMGAAQHKNVWGARLKPCPLIELQAQFLMKAVRYTYT
jgi:hypothetical protein